MRTLHRLPNLLLSLVIRIDRKGHELVETHAVIGIDVEQGWGNGGEPQPLLDDLDAHKEGSGDLLLAHALLTHVAERAELIKRVQALGYASSVLLAGLR
ncbi:hypothetical protein NGUA26_04451 [Salmonella enterica]|nr:hypothetical protein NGUA26_04451 [Salmonella enterica]